MRGAPMDLVVEADLLLRYKRHLCLINPGVSKARLVLIGNAPPSEARALE